MLSETSPGCLTQWQLSWASTCRNFNQVETPWIFSIFTWNHQKSQFQIVFLSTHTQACTHTHTHIQTHTHTPFWWCYNLVDDYFILYKNLKNLEQWFSALASRITQDPPPELYLIGLLCSPSNSISVKLMRWSQYSIRVVGHGARTMVLQQALKGLLKHRLLTTPSFWFSWSGGGLRICNSHITLMLLFQGPYFENHLP